MLTPLLFYLSYALLQPIYIKIPGFFSPTTNTISEDKLNTLKSFSFMIFTIIYHFVSIYTLTHNTGNTNKCCYMLFW